MTELREYQRLLAYDCDGMVLANFSAPPTVGAFRLVHRWDEQAYFLLFGQCWMQEQVSVRRFDIAIRTRAAVRA
jgi:hypothetical protein